MSKTHTWMPLYIGDYLRDTMHLSTEEHGAYLLILMASWTSGGVLDEENLPNIAKLNTQKWNQVGPTIAAFFVCENGAWIHPRVQAESQKAHDIYEKQAEAGRRSAKKRTLTDTHSDTHSDTLTKGQSPSQSHTQRTKIKSYRPDFDNFWNSYPKKEAKAVAIKAYTKARNLGVSAEILLEAVEKAKRESVK